MGYDYNEQSFLDSTRNVLIEKTNFKVKICVDYNFCGWWYSSMNDVVFEVRNGGFSDLKRRQGYKGHLTKYGFYVICSGKYVNNFISKRDAIKI